MPYSDTARAAEHMGIPPQILAVIQLGAATVGAVGFVKLIRDLFMKTPDSTHVGAAPPKQPGVYFPVVQYGGTWD